MSEETIVASAFGLAVRYRPMDGAPNGGDSYLLNPSLVDLIYAEGEAPISARRFDELMSEVVDHLVDRGLGLPEWVREAATRHRLRQVEEIPNEIQRAVGNALALTHPHHRIETATLGRRAVLTLRVSPGEFGDACWLIDEDGQLHVAKHDWKYEGCDEGRGTGLAWTHYRCALCDFCYRTHGDERLPVGPCAPTSPAQLARLREDWVRRYGSGGSL